MNDTSCETSDSKTFLYDLFSIMESSPGLVDAADHVLATSVHALGARQGILYLCDENSPSLMTLMSTHGDGFKVGINIPLESVSPEMQQALNDGMPRVFNGAPLPELLQARLHLRPGAENGSNLLIPLMVRDSGIGAMVLWRPGDLPPFSASDYKSTAQMLSHSGALVIQDRIVNERMLQQERFATLASVIAGITHDIKNILTGMRGGIGLIGMGLEQNRRDLMEKGHDIVSRNAQTLSDFVLQLLDLSRERQPEYQQFSVNDIIGRVQKLLAPECKATGIEIEVQAVREMLYLGDPDQIFRALLNLVHNAVDAVSALDATDRPRRVTISAYDATPGEITLSPTLRARADRWLVISVTDTGPGISKEDQSRIWRLFFTTKGQRGTGLGLPTTRRMIEEHGGRLYMQSDGCRGTTFTILLPHVRPTAEQVSHPGDKIS